MTGRHAPVPTLQQRLYWPTVVACATVGIAGLTGMARGVAPKVAADTSLSTFPEQVAEPTAHGGLGGPLAIPSIGVVATGTTEPAQRVQEAPATPSRPTGTGQAPTGAPSPTPEAAIAIPVAPTPPPVTTTAPAATTTPPTTPPPTTAPATTLTPTQEATTTSATTTATSTATTSEEP